MAMNHGHGGTRLVAVIVCGAVLILIFVVLKPGPAVKPKEKAHESAIRQPRQPVSEKSEVANGKSDSPERSSVDRIGGEFAGTEHLEGEDEAGAVEPTDEESIVASLRSAIELGAFEQCDPGAVLDVALNLAQLELEGHASLEQDPTGKLRYPLKDAPGGLRAELLIAKPSNPELGLMTGLRIEVEEPFEPYFVALLSV